MLMSKSFLYNLWLLTIYLTIKISSSSYTNKKDGQHKCIIENALSDVKIIIPASDPLHDTIRLHPQFATYRGTIQERDYIFQPTLITKPKTEEEIQDIVNFASNCGYTISVRSGGHSYSGLSSCNRLNGKCIQIDMENFNHIVYNKEDETDKNLITSITVGSGVKLGELYKTNIENNVAISGGNCQSVGAGGHFQTSSIGVWSRSLGNGFDWIFRIKLITADGKIRNVYKDSLNQKDKDLFWAILGGSAGSWGVIIEYEFDPIYDNDYPFSSFYVYRNGYNDDYAEALFPMMINLFNNKYFKMASDLTFYSSVNQVLDDPDDAFSHVGHEVTSAFSWSGNHIGDINDIIPGHPENKTWFEELIKPFKDLNDLYGSIQTPLFEGLSPISQVLLSISGDADSIDVPPSRYYNVHASYKQDVLDETIFSNDTLKSIWIESMLNEIKKTTHNLTDNLAILWQFICSGGKDNYVVNDDLTINFDPLKNAVSFPLRDVQLTIDSWVQFGNFDEYNNNLAIKAKQTADNLKNILTANQVKSDINHYAFTDELPVEYLQDDDKFDKFFPDRMDVFKKLQDIKTKVDCDNVFSGPITIPPNEDCKKMLNV